MRDRRINGYFRVSHGTAIPRWLLSDRLGLSCRRVSRSADLGLFLDTGGPPLQSSQVVKLGAAHRALPCDFQRINQWRVEREDSLNANAAACDSPNSEVGCRTGAILTANNNALEGLHALPVPFADAEVNPHRIPRAKSGELGTVFRFDQLRCIHDFYLVVGFQRG